MASTETQGAVELWWAELDVDAAALAEAEATLAPSELERAARFASGRDRDRFVAARARLRRVLADQLGCAPSEIGFAQGEAGKPSVPGSPLRFSASRSGPTALFATSWTMEVGVDVERIGEGRDVERIAARFFTSGERAAIEGLAGDARIAAAFQCWSCKEAYVKGTGEGLSADLATLGVWSPDLPSTTIRGWQVFRVDLAADLAAAVAGRSLGGWTPGPVHYL